MQPLERGEQLNVSASSKRIFETSNPNKLLKVIVQNPLLRSDGTSIPWGELDQKERLAYLRQTFYLHKLMELVHPDFSARISAIDAKEGSYLVEKIDGEGKYPEQKEDLVEELLENGILVDTVGDNFFVRPGHTAKETYVDEFTTMDWQRAYGYLQKKLSEFGNGQIDESGKYYLDQFESYSKQVDTILEHHPNK